MKLVYLTPFQFFGAIVIGILLSLTVGGILMSPAPVSEQPQAITPVPTPREVYVQPTYQPPTQQQQDAAQPSEPTTIAEEGMSQEGTGVLYEVLGASLVLMAVVTILGVFAVLVRPL